MKCRWNVNDCWIASLDILGFSNLVNIQGDTIKIDFLQDDYEETLLHLKSQCKIYEPDSLKYLWFSDTFIMYTLDDSAKSYTIIQQAAKHFITNCIYSCIPIRGAISTGTLIRSNDNKAVMGNAFIDAHLYGEDQDWIGLLLTPTAIQKANSYGLEPSHHDFVDSNKIPMRKYKDVNVVAYRFQNGAANFQSPLIKYLESMKATSNEKYHSKYSKTIDFINENYQWVK